jgi:hypothetical protein
MVIAASIVSLVPVGTWYMSSDFGGSASAYGRSDPGPNAADFFVAEQPAASNAAERRQNAVRIFIIALESPLPELSARLYRAPGTILADYPPKGHFIREGLHS